MTVRGPGNIQIRERRRMPRPQYDGGRAAYSMLLGLGAFLLIGALSFRQLSSPAVAHQLIAEGVAAITEIDLVIDDYRAALQQAAVTADPGDLLTPEGYPLPVRFTRDEALTLDEAEFRELVLGRSASVVYEDGLDAFDQEGRGGPSLFSREGLLDSLVGMLSETNHSRSGVAAAVLGLLTAIAAVIVVIRSRGFSRVRALGFPVLVAAIFGLVATFVIAAVLGRWWAGDPFSDQVDAIIEDAVGIARRNFAILGGLGLVLVLGGIVFELLGRFVFRAPSEAGVSDRTT